MRDVDIYRYSHLYGKESPVCIFRILLEKTGKELEIACAEVVRVELPAVEEHLCARWEGIDARLDGLEADLIGDRVGCPTAPHAGRKVSFHVVEDAVLRTSSS